MTVSHKTRWHSNSIPKYLPKGNENINSPKNLKYRSLINNGPKQQKAVCPPTQEWIKKQKQKTKTKQNNNKKNGILSSKKKKKKKCWWIKLKYTTLIERERKSYIKDNIPFDSIHMEIIESQN